MFKKFASLALICMALSNLSAEFSEPVVTVMQKIIGIEVFDGDSKGEFKGDLVAVIQDGSAWKIHPTRQEKFQKWSLDDDIHVGVRTSHYWFKREHKFQLVNHTRNEVIKVMLVKYPDTALYVTRAETYVSHTTTHTSVFVDSQGRSHTSYYNKNHYAKRMILSDGSYWTIADNLEQFLIGNTVYIGTHNYKDSSKYFIINGINRNATYSWANKVY